MEIKPLEIPTKPTKEKVKEMYLGLNDRDPYKQLTPHPPCARHKVYNCRCLNMRRVK